MPQSHVRLSAGREDMSDEMQALCFLAGANSIFYGEKLLTTANPQADKDLRLFERLGIEPKPHHGYDDEIHEAVIGDALQEQEQLKVRYYDAS